MSIGPFSHGSFSQLYMNTKGEAQGLTGAFIQYILGPEGKQMTAAAGYLPL